MINFSFGFLNFQLIKQKHKKIAINLWNIKSVKLFYYDIIILLCCGKIIFLIKNFDF